ncbi:MAG: CC/Se motif family (seleno)protein [Bacillota bacterium]
MIITMEEEVKNYLDKNGAKKLLIDMTPDLTNSGCGCGKAKKYYTPYIRIMKSDEYYKDYTLYHTDNADIFLSPKVLEAAEDVIKIKLEKTLFMKKLEVEGIGFIVE